MTGIEIATIAGTAITLGDAALAASTLIGGIGAIQQGNAQRAAGEAQARSAAYQAQLNNAQAAAMEQNAGQERALAQREAKQQTRAGKLLSSRAQAISAASGGGALDPSVVNILAGIDSETAQRAGNALYTGEERARGLEYGAVLQRAGGQGQVYAGEVARRAGESAASRSFLSAGGTVLGGAGALSERFERRKARNTLLSQAGGFGRYASDDPLFGDTYY